MKNLAIVALLSQSCGALKFDYFKAPNEIKPYDYQINEDYHSVPDPISGVNWMTATQAKYFRNNQTDVSSEPQGIDMDYFSAYNENSPEPVMKDVYLQLDQDIEYSKPAQEVTVLWHVSPDYGENDDSVVNREQDTKNGEKHSGWTNPLGHTDDGSDDHLILAQGHGGVGKSTHSIEQANYDNRHVPPPKIEV